MDIANAPNKAAREKLIKELPKKNTALAQAFEDAKHDAEAQSKFIREGGRFPLTAVGDINTYAVFAEITRSLINDNGRVGVIVPTGIATDMTTKNFFENLINTHNLVSLYDFENREHLFSALHTKTKFCFLIISNAIRNNEKMFFAFMITNPSQLTHKERIFSLSIEDIYLLNPNSKTCPIFRTNFDCELTKKIYKIVPVLENESTGSNPWEISFMSMFHMANDSHLFKNEAREGLLPLYEAKMFYLYDHRWMTYPNPFSTERYVEETEKNNCNFKISPRYWVESQEVYRRLNNKWNNKWFLGFRDITDSRNERSGVFSIFPLSAVGGTIRIIISNKNVLLLSCLLANQNSAIFDYITKQKIGGLHLTGSILKQLPVIPPEKYTQKDIEYITPRVLELVYTSWDMQPFALDMGYNGEPFIWNPNKRALIRAELDAYYAKLYQLTRDELRYILDPADVYGADFPSETFRVLKNNETKQFGEYRTQRLVLEAWDRIIRNS